MSEKELSTLDVESQSKQAPHKDNYYHEKDENDFKTKATIVVDNNNNNNNDIKNENEKIDKNQSSDKKSGNENETTSQVVVDNTYSDEHNIGQY